MINDYEIEWSNALRISSSKVRGVVVEILLPVTQAAAEDSDVASSRAKRTPKLIKPQRPTRGPTADRVGARF